MNRNNWTYVIYANEAQTKFCVFVNKMDLHGFQNTYMVFNSEEAAQKYISEQKSLSDPNLFA